MAVLKCKMCGGELNASGNASVVECEFCGTKQTIPTSKDENLQGLFNRANILRMKSEFDKAAEIYEKIIQKDETQAEAYWGIILCKYGIEYVEDPQSFKRIPTCHRTSFDSIIADEDYKSALSYADSVQREIYESEAKEIDRLQKDILSIVHKEDPFDVFICYKETDADGKRTQDSVIANDIYHQLTQEGFKVFYAAITLENKLGTAYEPYIFAALNSAKVMLVIGTKPEYFNAVWVKNEWSRFLKLIPKDRTKLLIPCYRDMDAYELPEEFAHLQAQDMSKIGFINDVVRGIKKVINPDEQNREVVKETAAQSINANIEPLLKRAFMFLEDGDWNSANEYCEKVLDTDPENAEAYLGKLMAEMRVKKQADLKNCREPFESRNNYKKIMRFGDGKLKTDLQNDIEHIKKRNENARLQGVYTDAKNAMSKATTESKYKEAAYLFESISEYKDSTALEKECYKKAEEARKDAILADGKARMTDVSIAEYESAIKLFESISGWKDADEQIIICQKKIEESKAADEAKRLEQEKQEQIARAERERIAKRNKKIAIIAAPIVCAIIAFVIILNTVIIPVSTYKKAKKLLENEKYTEAMLLYGKIYNYKDSTLLRKKCDFSNKIGSDGFFSYGIKTDGSIVNTDFKNEGASVNAATNMFELLCGTDEEFVKVSTSNAAWYVAAITKNGMVKILPFNYDDTRMQNKVDKWCDIVDICVGDYSLAGVKKNGTAVFAWNLYRDYKEQDCGQNEVSKWTDLVDIAVGKRHTVGLKSDGTVVAVGDNSYGQCEVSDWSNIIDIYCGQLGTYGLKSNGTVIFTGGNTFGESAVANWQDIVALSVGSVNIIGLKSDGTVISTSLPEKMANFDYGQCNVKGWSNMIGICGDFSRLALKKDGTVVAIGYNEHGQCDINDWNLFK